MRRAASRTAAVVSSLIAGSPLSARLTVAIETPSWAATSRIVTGLATAQRALCQADFRIEGQHGLNLSLRLAARARAGPMASNLEYPRRPQYSDVGLRISGPKDSPSELPPAGADIAGELRER